MTSDDDRKRAGFGGLSGPNDRGENADPWTNDEPIVANPMEPVRPPWSAGEAPRPSPPPPLHPYPPMHPYPPKKPPSTFVLLLQIIVVMAVIGVALTVAVFYLAIAQWHPQ